MIVTAAFGILQVPAWIASAQGTMPEGSNASCTIEQLDDLTGDKARATTSCGTVLIPDVFIDKVTIGEAYDFEVNTSSEHGKVGIPMGVHER